MWLNILQIHEISYLYLIIINIVIYHSLRYYYFVKINWTHKAKKLFYDSNNYCIIIAKP